MACMCRAIIHKETGDVTMAVVNYTQAIKNNPRDDDAYYQRAEMYEAVSVLLCLTDLLEVGCLIIIFEVLTYTCIYVCV